MYFPKKNIYLSMQIQWTQREMKKKILSFFLK